MRQGYSKPECAYCGRDDPDTFNGDSAWHESCEREYEEENSRYEVEKYNKQLRGGKMDIVEVGQKIKTRRETCGITQEELADMAGITQASLSQFETNKRFPSIKTLEKILESLNIKPEPFLEKSQNDYIEWLMRGLFRKLDRRQRLLLVKLAKELNNK